MELMGTNFYHRYNACDCCGRYEERHIGKSWSMFQGYRGEDEKEPVASWQEWKVTLRAGGEIWDEYGVRIDAEDFISDVEDTDPAYRRRQFDWTQNYAAEYQLPLDHDWLDADGFSFCDQEFS